MWRSGVNIMIKHPLLVWLPIFLDVIFVTISWKWAVSVLNSVDSGIKFALPVGLPTIGDIVPIFTAGSVPFQNSWLLIPLSIIVMMIHAYIQGGYIISLHRASTEKKLNFKAFMQHANYHFIKLAIVYIGLFILLTVIAAGFQYFLGKMGLILFIFVAVTLRIFYILFEFILVVDDRAIMESLVRSRQLIRRDWKRNIYKTTWLMLAANLFFFLIAGLFRSFLPFLVLIIVYIKVMVYFQIVLMSNYERVRY